MKNFLFILVAIAILAALHFTGALISNKITHPAWNFNALIFGGLGGAVFAFLKFKISTDKPALEKKLSTFVNVVFGIALISTLYFANRFVNAENFDLFSADIWHWSSYAVIASFIPQVSQLMKKIFTG